MIEYKTKFYKTLIKSFDQRELDSLWSYYRDSNEYKKEWPKQMEFQKDLELIAGGRPIQYVTSLSFFYGFHFFVNASCLIPRPETEELVYWIESEWKKSSDLRILDIGAGSGCIALSLLLKLDNANGLAVDLSEEALEVVRRNAENLNVSIETINTDVLSDDWFKPVGRFNVVVCNPPYILKEEIERMDDSVLNNEPEMALFVEGNDPLVFYKKIILDASMIIEQGGAMYFETSDLYHEALEDFVKSKGHEYKFKRDMQGKWRMLKLQF